MRNTFAFLALLAFAGAALAAAPEPGIVKADKNYVTVIARGQGTDRTRALEKAWTDAVRLAVGMVLSSKTEVNDGELAEDIITHSRGVIESFDILDEMRDDRRTTVTIQAMVHRETLTDAAKTYVDAQTVKAQTGEAVKAQMDDRAKQATKDDMQRSGVALLREVLEAYGPESFFSAKLDPKVRYDRNTGKAYIQVTEKFDQELFWKEFIPRLHRALEAVATKKEKKFYVDPVRKANQQLPRAGYLLRGGGIDFFNRLKPSECPYSLFTTKDNSLHSDGILQADWKDFSWSWKAVIPNDNASFTLYYMPVLLKHGGYHLPVSDIFDVSGLERALKNNPGNVDPLEIVPLWLDFLRKMSCSVFFSVAYLDKDGEEISGQVIRTGRRYPAVYRSIRAGNPLLVCDGMLIAPGYVSNGGRDLFLGTANYTREHGGGYEVELDAGELERLDSMKFEVIFGDG